MCKKMLGVLLGAVMLMTILCGCGFEAAESGGVSEKAPKDTEGRETVSLLSWYSEKQLGEFIDSFEEEYPDIRIDLQYVPPVQQYIDKFSVLVASGQMTDMFYTAAENKQEIIERELAEDISGMEVFERIDSDTAGTYGKDGEIYAYSPDAWLAGVFYNVDLFKEAGIGKAPETWDEFIDACAKLKELGVEPYLDDAENVHNLSQDLYQSMVISKNPDTDVRINNGESTYAEQYTEPFKIWYEDLVEPGLYSPMSLGLNSDQVIDMFANGEAAMIHGGPWTVNTIEEKNPDLNYDIFAVADKEGNRVYPGALNVGLSISTGSEHKEACEKFIEFMSRDENILKWQKISNNVIIVKGIDYDMGTVFEKVKDEAVNGNFYLPQIVWKNSAGIYKEFLTGIQDAITGANTIENIPVRMDEKQAELSR